MSFYGVATASQCGSGHKDALTTKNLREPKILLATDLTEKSQAAEQAAFALAERLGVQLVILHVMPERSAFGMVTSLPELRQPEMLKRKLEALGDEEAPDAVRLLQSGPAAETIVNVVQAQNVDLIVVATVGRQGLPRAVLGSVAEVIVRQATCPVMVVKSTIDLPGA